MLLVAFLVVGPKDLPRVARWLGRMVKKIRALIREVKKETGWDDLEKEMKETQSSLNAEIKDIQKDLDVSADLKGVSDELQKSASDIRQELAGAEKAAEESTKS